ncbi:hypothetical protein [Metapseudomonas boanensis]|uniref:Uncharacterized protein n=1 Tax=Metapseudomonas boanensis TaxID=2822138 RepID=A0ABS5XK87_9GAMM|nr:hypothetical protein [Pseudomonas boanensis]MBT8767556.1 hypothetical protein [Pseudomonas boanensis]
MPIQRRRVLRISFNPWLLTMSIALGIWLGFVAVALTGYAGYKLYMADAPAPVSQVAPPPPQPAQPSPDEKRLQQYEDNYNAAQREENARLQKLEEARRLGDAKCQFWTEQYRNAPTDKARRNMEQYCN